VAEEVLKRPPCRAAVRHQPVSTGTNRRDSTQTARARGLTPRPPCLISPGPVTSWTVAAVASPPATDATPEAEPVLSCLPPSYLSSHYCCWRPTKVASSSLLSSKPSTHHPSSIPSLTRNHPIIKSQVSPSMKSALIAAAALVGSAQAGVHKMKLQKISLEQQLVRNRPNRPLHGRTSTNTSLFSNRRAHPSRPKSSSSARSTWACALLAVSMSCSTTTCPRSRAATRSPSPTS
jgi:hypothetical protein